MHTHPPTHTPHHTHNSATYQRLAAGLLVLLTASAYTLYQVGRSLAVPPTGAAVSLGVGSMYALSLLATAGV